MAPRGLIVASFGVIVLAVAAVADVPIGAGNRGVSGAASDNPPCAGPGRPMDETIGRMFALMAAGDTDRLSSCSTEGKADVAMLGAYLAAGAPTAFSVDSEHTIGRNGLLYAAVRARASWAGAPPPRWDRAEQQIIVMRQRRDWSWTIDTIQPRIPEAQSDPHCGICHR